MQKKDFSHLDYQIWRAEDIDCVDDYINEQMPFIDFRYLDSRYWDAEDLEGQMAYNCQDVELDDFVYSEGSPSPRGHLKRQDLSKHPVVFNHPYRDKLAPTMTSIPKKYTNNVRCKK